MVIKNSILHTKVIGQEIFYCNMKGGNFTCQHPTTKQTTVATWTGVNGEWPISLSSTGLLVVLACKSCVEEYSMIGLLAIMHTTANVPVIEISYISNF